LKYPHDIYSIKIEYVEQGQERFTMTGYHNQSSFLHIFSRFHEEYQGCDIISVSLIKVTFTDQINHSPEIEVGKIPLPVGYDWLK